MPIEASKPPPDLAWILPAFCEWCTDNRAPEVVIHYVDVRLAACWRCAGKFGAERGRQIGTIAGLPEVFGRRPAGKQPAWDPMRGDKCMCHACRAQIEALRKSVGL